MYFRGWIHSWVCGTCSDADNYWRLRAFWAGVKRKGGPFTPPRRCPSTDLWFDMWWYGAESSNEELEF
jgi:hypothetical protein